MLRILKAVARRLLRMEDWCKQTARQFFEQRALDEYLKSDRRPWRAGYNLYRLKYLSAQVRDEFVLQVFRHAQALPPNYGFRVDSRAVEIPWVLARLAQRAGRLLDAGSALNLECVLSAPALAPHKITITTLAPEAVCYWFRGVSYVFGDLRDLDFRDDWFDAVACISTIEHVGMDNAMYAHNSETARRSNAQDFVRAVKELRRVLKPGGSLYITFPFGRYEDHGWFQQFDAALADQVIAAFAPTQLQETVFRYDPDGWKLSERGECAECCYFDVHASKYFDPHSQIEYPPDFPAGERAVMCLELIK